MSQSAPAVRLRNCDEMAHVGTENDFPFGYIVISQVLRDYI